MDNNEGKRLTLTIDLGNEAMNCPEDVAQALQELAARLSSPGMGFTPGFGLNIRDVNGNTVGRLECTQE